VEELRFGDNDRLSAEVAVLAEAELLILLTSVDGLMDHAGKRIPMIADVADAARFVRKEKSRLSVGGMVSKLEAVKLAIAAGIPTVIANAGAQESFRGLQRASEPEHCFLCGLKRLTRTRFERRW